MQIYNLLKDKRLELYLILSTTAALVTVGNIYLQIVSVILINTLFLSKRLALSISLLLILLIVFINFTSIITNVKNEGKEKSTYESTRGTVLAENSLVLKAGEAIIGKYARVPYRGYSGKLAPGYLSLEQIYYRVELPLITSILKWREALAKKMYIESAGRLSITQALLVGDKRYLNGKIQDEYLLTGLSHLLAVSGTHAGVITLICFTALFFLPIKIRMLISCFALAAFVPLAGFKVPVMRSAFSGIIIMTAYMLDFRVELRKLVLFLWSFFILIAPSLLVNISFLLSFAAIYGIASLKFKGMGWLEGTIKVGIVATAFTLPLSMFVFGTMNIASIVNTAVMVPVVYMQLITGFLYMIAPSISLHPLILLEQLNSFTSYILTKCTDYFFVLKFIDVYMFAFLTILLIAISRTKYILATSIVFLAVFIPTNMENGLYFPELGSYRSFIYKDETNNEAFFSGMRGSYIFSFLPFAAKFGTTVFDYAQVEVYGEENIIFKSKHPDQGFSKICINDLNCEKPYIYMTRSNTINKKNIKSDKVYFVYKNKFKSDNIIELYDSAPLRYEFNKRGDQ